MGEDFVRQAPAAEVSTEPLNADLDLAAREKSVGELVEGASQGLSVFIVREYLLPLVAYEEGEAPEVVGEIAARGVGVAVPVVVLVVLGHIAVVVRGIGPSGTLRSLPVEEGPGYGLPPVFVVEEEGMDGLGPKPSGGTIGMRRFMIPAAHLLSIR